MAFGELAGNIFSAAAEIYHIVQEVRSFKQRSQRLKKRIENLMPMVEKLDSSDQEVPDEGLKIYSKALGDLLQLIQSSSCFIESLQEKSFPIRLLHKDTYSDRFDEYSEGLDILRGTLQLGLAVDAREVMYKLRIEEDRKDEMEDEASLLNEYKKVQKKILEEIGKQTKGGDEILKSIQELNSMVSQLTQIKGKSLRSKQPSTAEGLKEIDHNQLNHKREIASGRFGKTYRAKYMLQDVALKSYSVGIHKDVKDILLQEAKTLMLLNSISIVRLWGVCTQMEPYLLVFEFMSRGKLRDILSKVGRDFKILPWERRIKMCLDGALGLYRMHNTRPSLLHQDLASDNFLVDENWRMKLSGVGFAKTQTSILKNSKQTRTSGRTTLYYVCPERLENINLPATASTDVYSYGIVMWEIATGSKPYEGKSNDDTHKFVLIEKKKLPLPSDCPGVFKNVIEQCREFDPLARPTSSDIVDTLQKSLNELLK